MSGIRSASASQRVALKQQSEREESPSGADFGVRGRRHWAGGRKGADEGGAEEARSSEQKASS